MALNLVSSAFLAATAMSRAVSAVPTVTSAAHIQSGAEDISTKVKDLAEALRAFPNDGKGTMEQSLVCTSSECLHSFKSLIFRF
jgi:hypothetical protein